MNKDKTLTQTVREVLLQKEKLVDKLCFILPLQYGDIDLTDAVVTLEYTDPANVVHTELLVAEEEIYKETKLRYFMPVDTKLTKLAGDIELRLTIVKVDISTLKQHVLHTFPTTLTVQPLKNLYEIIPDESLNVLDEKLLQLDAKIKAVEMMSEAYSAQLPEDLTITGNLLQLSNQEGTIGTGVEVMVPEQKDDEAGDEGNEIPESPDNPDMPENPDTNIPENNTGEGSHENEEDGNQ